MNERRVLHGIAIGVIVIIMISSNSLSAAEKPDWCEQLPRPEYKNLERVQVPDSWFEVYRIRPGVFAVYEPHQFQEVISYLITGEKRALLFDTGMGISRIRPIVNHLTNLPVLVLNSHTHPDHVGGNFEFEKILGQNTNYTKKNSGGYSSADLPDWASGANVCGPLPTNFDGDHYSIAPFSIFQFVSDRQIIDLGERQLQIIFTPGHTSDSLCLLDTSNGLLFTGDLFYSGPIYLFSPETDFAAYVRSVELLHSLKPDVHLLLPAHNVPVASPDMLTELNNAVLSVQKGNADYIEKEGIREYDFKSFSLLLKTFPR